MSLKTVRSPAPRLCTVGTSLNGGIDSRAVENDVVFHAEWETAWDFVDAVPLKKTQSVLKENGQAWSTGDYHPKGLSATRAQKTIRQGIAPPGWAQEAHDAKERVEQEIRVRGDMDMSRRFKRIRSEDGVEVDMDRYMQGRDDYMIDYRRGRDMPFVRLAVDVGLSWQNGPKAFKRLASAAVAVADVLTVRGLAVQLDVLACFQNYWHNPIPKDKFYIWSAPVKRGNEPVDIEACLGYINQSAYRGIYFGHFSDDNSGVDYGLSGPPGSAGEVSCSWSCRGPSPYLTTMRYLGFDYVFSRKWTEDGDQVEDMCGLIDNLYKGEDIDD